jgi:uncharacterized RmlC-like cupin family protein
MDRKAAINPRARRRAKPWAGTAHSTLMPRPSHHHRPVESVIYVVSGRARMKWGDRLEFTAEAGPGDFIYVPPFVPHQEINASEDEPLSCVLCRSGQQPVVVNLDLPNVEPNPEQVHWGDNIHPCVSLRTIKADSFDIDGVTHTPRGAMQGRPMPRKPSAGRPARPFSPHACAAAPASRPSRCG